MITIIKDVLSDVLVQAGVPKEKIARSAREEQTLSSRREDYPLASLVSDPGRFEEADHKEVKVQVDGKALYRQMRIRRVLPVVAKVITESEEQAADIVSRFIGNLPFTWEYPGFKGDVDPVREEYSDYDSRMRPRYEAAVVVEFGIDAGTAGLAAEKITAVDTGGGRYEKQQTD